MASINLKSAVEYIKGVGPQKAELLNKEFSVFTVDDLLKLYPYLFLKKSWFSKEQVFAIDLEEIL